MFAYVGFQFIWHRVIFNLWSKYVYFIIRFVVVYVAYLVCWLLFRVLESVQGSQERVCGGSLGAGGVMKWLSEVPPLSDEQMKKVCITLHDFRVSMGEGLISSDVMRL